MLNYTRGIKQKKVIISACFECPHCAKETDHDYYCLMLPNDEPLEIMRIPCECPLPDAGEDEEPVQAKIEAAKPNWQPIKDAPKDRTIYAALAFGEGFELCGYLTKGAYHGENKNARPEPDWFIELTEPPKEKE